MKFHPQMAAVFMTVPHATYSPVELADRIESFGRKAQPRINRIFELEALRKPTLYRASDGAMIPGYGPLSRRAERAIATLHLDIESYRRVFFPE